MLDRNKIINKSIERYGESDRMIVSAKTLGSMQETIMDSILGKDSELSMIEKMAETYIALEHLKAIYNIEDKRLNEEINFQLLLLNERMENGGC